MHWFASNPEIAVAPARATPALDKAQKKLRAGAR
jgi:hypothetical protein